MKASRMVWRVISFLVDQLVPDGQHLSWLGVLQEKRTCQQQNDEVAQEEEPEMKKEEGQETLEKVFA